jgi:hypothetical protein
VRVSRYCVPSVVLVSGTDDLRKAKECPGGKKIILKRNKCMTTNIPWEEYKRLKLKDK